MRPHTAGFNVDVRNVDQEFIEHWGRPADGRLKSIRFYATERFKTNIFLRARTNELFLRWVRKMRSAV